MAHHKRKRPASVGGKRYSGHGLSRRLAQKGIREADIDHYSSTPRWWNKLHHIRPGRVETRRQIGLILSGADPDGICWRPAKKPHLYYW